MISVSGLMGGKIISVLVTILTPEISSAAPVTIFTIPFMPLINPPTGILRLMPDVSPR